MMGDRKVVEVETVLEQVNKLGVYQATQYVVALLPVVMTAMSNANYVFAAASDQYRYTVYGELLYTTERNIASWSNIKKY